MEKKFEVIRSSAGSGKTYSLVKKFIILSLKSYDDNYYSKILAITFTNKAAYEMKNRVILGFRDLSENLNKSYMSDISKETIMSSNSINVKSR